jgi:hypothetical protein
VEVGATVTAGVADAAGASVGDASVVTDGAGVRVAVDATVGVTVAVGLGVALAVGVGGGPESTRLTGIPAASATKRTGASTSAKRRVKRGDMGKLNSYQLWRWGTEGFSPFRLY